MSIRHNIHPNIGATLIELIVVTVILGLLAIVSAPTVQTYFERVRVARGVSIGRTVQAALAASTMTDVADQYPAHIDSYADLIVMVNANGASSSHTDAGGCDVSCLHAIGYGR